MAQASALRESHLSGLKLLNRGKVRDIYAIDELKFLTQYNIEPVVAAEAALEETMGALGNFGVIVRGAYGEHSQNIGDLTIY